MYCCGDFSQILIRDSKQYTEIVFQNFQNTFSLSKRGKPFGWATLAARNSFG